MLASSKKHTASPSICLAIFVAISLVCWLGREVRTVRPNNGKDCKSNFLELHHIPGIATKHFMEMGQTTFEET